MGYIIAKLHRFYGPAPTPSNSWLDVPQWLFEVYDRATPRLEAEEQQILLKTLIAGTGHMEEKHFDTYQRELHSQATGQKAKAWVGRARSREEFEMLVRGLDVRGFKLDIKD